jgi:uncharacterized membrane protein YphA (DoxX/SURF4 family)
MASNLIRDGQQVFFPRPCSSSEPKDFLQVTKHIPIDAIVRNTAINIRRSADPMPTKQLDAAVQNAHPARTTINATSSQTITAPANSLHHEPAANGLALVRLTIGAMFVWVFFENLSKGLYTPGGYAGLIHYYIEHGHAPAVWKAIMGSAASHAAMAAPLQAVAEISFGVLLVVGLLTRPVAFAAFLYLGSLWMSEWGTAWIWELLVPVLASLALAVGRAGRSWGIDAWLAKRRPENLWW